MATLEQLVNETTNIKNELKTCHSNLKNALAKKGVEVVEEDKMSSLINKVNSINIPKATFGETCIAFKGCDIQTPFNSNSYTLVSSFRYVSLSGAYRVSAFSMTNNRNFAGKIKFEHKRGDAVLFSKQISVSSTSLTKYTVDIDNVEFGDEILLYASTSNTSVPCYVKDFVVSFDLL